MSPGKDNHLFSEPMLLEKSFGIIKRKRTYSDFNLLMPACQASLSNCCHSMTRRHESSCCQKLIYSFTANQPTFRTERQVANIQAFIGKLRSMDTQFGKLLSNEYGTTNSSLVMLPADAFISSRSCSDQAMD